MELLALQGVVYITQPLDGWSIPAFCKRGNLPLPQNALCGACIDGILFDVVWNPGNNRLHFMLHALHQPSDSGERKTSERNLAHWASDRVRSSQLYDRKVTVFVQDDKTMERFLNESTGKLDVRNVAGRGNNSQLLCEQLQKLFERTIPAPGNLPAPKKPARGTLPDNTLVVCLGTNVAPTLHITLTARQPLVITDGSAESMAHQTLTHIPGNMLLGAFASAWVAAHPGGVPDDSPEFCSLFLNGAVTWGHALPMVGKNATVPVPLCLQKDKNASGLPAEGDTETEKIYNSLRTDPKTLSEVKLKKLSAGFMDTLTFCRPDTLQLWTMHVALGKERRALQSQLFGYAALAPETRFRATVRCRTPEIGAALLKLASGTPTLRLGHARSAGYGLVDCAFAEVKSETANITAKELTLFLHTEYVPTQSWLSPMDSLEKELTTLCGVPITQGVAFSGHTVIQGFNSLWGLPRTARTALVRGSVIQFTTPKPVTLPKYLTLGADQREGYGCIELNPAFLDQSVITPKTLPARKQELPVTAPSSMLNVLRRRALDRLAIELATEWLAEKNWRKFIESAAKSHIRQSQRGNVRHMVMETASSEWVPQFEEILSKTPGTQWKNAVAFSPFSQRNEHMNDIMPQILDQQTCLAVLETTHPKLPGGPTTDAEAKPFLQTAHKLFVLELLRAWEKQSRTDTNREES